MENSNKNLKKNLRIVLLKYKNVIVVIFLILLPLVYFEIRFTMERDQAWIEYHFVQCKVKVSYNTNETKYIDIIRNDEIITVNKLTGEQNLEYTFINSNLGIVANFSKVEVVFYMDKDLYSEYEQIEGRFFIEDKSGVIRKYDYDLSLEGLPFYISIRDISNLMFKDAVPNEIRITIKLFNE